MAHQKTAPQRAAAPLKRRGRAADSGRHWLRPTGAGGSRAERRNGEVWRSRAGD